MTGNPRNRVCELLADRAVGALDDAEASELDALFAVHPELAKLDDDGFELTVAVAGIAMNGGDEPLPARLRRHVAADADSWFGGSKAKAGLTLLRSR